MNFRRYFVELTAAGLLYFILLVAANGAERAYHPQGTARIALALLPMLGCLAIVWSIMRAIRLMDEMQRRIQFEALAFAFAVTALATFSYGFLEGAGLPRFPVFGVWPLMAVCWVVGIMLATRRYR